ncbi:MAG TPA: tRNA lysidine(34) synthetase TilS, partial [Flavisolibacter sp.]|nr:tRNA lysidine(34) synthetase TilS [Flavisolibacter sp.]
MNLLDHFKKTIAPYGMLNTEQKVLVAVSGGVDSVVLTHLCNAAGLHFCIAHCNFCLRGEESKRDEVFVKSMGKKYNVEVFVKQFDTSKYAEENQISIQEAARKLRYQFFGELKKENHFSFTLLAHNANDQIETLLINFFRGTGLTGLTGMPVLNKDSANALRPLLQVPREQIGAYA